MQIKVPLLVDRRLKRNMSILGWIVFALAVAYVYAVPHLMYPEAFALVDGKIEALLLGLATLYLYAYGSKDVPWLILLVLRSRALPAALCRRHNSCSIANALSLAQPLVELRF